MATRAVFIGVNKHADPSIPELSGAARDAMALWALFTDTLAAGFQMPEEQFVKVVFDRFRS